MESTTQNTFEVTENAAKRIAQLIEMEGNDQLKMRVTVDGGGCSGFQYKFSFDAKQNQDDRKIEKNGVSVLVDDISMGFLNGSKLDYVETLGAAHFEIKNPNATATCGCGNSFSV